MGALAKRVLDALDAHPDLDLGIQHLLIDVRAALLTRSARPPEPYTFVASNGITFEPRNDGKLGGPNPGTPGWKEAVIELFEYDRHDQIVTWRWPQDPCIVVIRNETTLTKGSRWAYAYDIRRIGKGSWYCADTSRKPKPGEDEPMHEATHAYFEAVPLWEGDGR